MCTYLILVGAFVTYNITLCYVVLPFGNALTSTNIVTLRQARLVPGWVTVLGQVNHLGANQAPRSIQPEPFLRG